MRTDGFAVLGTRSAKTEGRRILIGPGRNEDILKRHLCLSVCQTTETMDLKEMKISPKHLMPREEKGASRWGEGILYPRKRSHTVLRTCHTVTQPYGMSLKPRQ